jgi:hypothetical protein
MKFYKKGIAQTIVLDQAGIASNSTIKFSIVGEDGTHLKDSANTDLKDITLVYNATSLKFEKEITILATTPEQYIRLYFYGTGGVVVSSIYYPEDAKLEANIGVVTASAEIVPVQYYIDYILAASAKVNDPNFQTAVQAYIADKNGIRSFLKSAQDDLEKDAEMYFTERTLTEKRDNFYEEFPSHLWQFQVAYPPLNELVSMQIMYGDNLVADIGVNLFVHDRMMGLIEFLPLPGGSSAGLYTLLLENISGVAITILRGGLLRRIPNMFKATYKTGIFVGADEFEKEGLRKAISRRAFMDSMHIIDPAGRQGNDSESIDGVSKSRTFRTDKILDKLQKEETEYIKKLQKKYGKTINMVIA